MKIFLVLLLCSLLSITKCDWLETDSGETSTISNDLERRRLPIFPKYNLKFTVKPHETDKLATQNIHDKEESETRRPLMVKIVPKNKKTSVKTKEIVTRKPLMKVISYTVKMRSSKKGTTDILTIDKLNKPDNVRKIPRSFEIDDKPEIKKSMNQNNKFNERDLYQSSRNIIPAGTIKNVPKMSKGGDFSEEEDQDRHEFIFLEKNRGLIDKDLLYVSEEDYELTTMIMEPRNLRSKRSSNIIEEENMGTTVSPLKFTGHDSRLTNDLYFKNINH